MEQNDWMNNPKLEGMDQVKIELLKNIASQSEGKSANEMAPLLMAAATSANSKGISFSPEEMDLIIEIMKMGKSKEEQAKMDQFIRMAKTMMPKKKK